MTYWQSLKSVARGLLRWPLPLEDAEAICDNVKDLSWNIMIVTLRFIILLTLPISAPIMTLIVHLYRKNKEKGNV